jgi:hypothetical protein
LSLGETNFLKENGLSLFFSPPSAIVYFRGECQHPVVGEIIFNVWRETRKGRYSTPKWMVFVNKVSSSFSDMRSGVGNDCKTWPVLGWGCHCLRVKIQNNFRPQALDVQWVKCRGNVDKKILSLLYNNLYYITVTLFFPHWPYILFIERRVPVFIHIQSKCTVKTIYIE